METACAEEKKIEALLYETKIPEEKVVLEAYEHWNKIAKPLHSLGKLETIISRMAGIQGESKEVHAEKAALVIMCADHGVVAEGVTQTGYEITKIVTDNFGVKKTSAAIMAEASCVDIFPVDIGINCESYPEKKLQKNHVLDRKIAAGSGNIVKEMAMSEIQCRQALQTGIDLVGELKNMGYHIIATGEMGIGNTTPSSALVAYFLGQPAENVTGKGAGLSESGIQKKIQAVEKAIQRYQKSNTEKTPIQTLANLGGYDIAGMTGLFLGGFIHKVPVIIDGFISAAAALCAVEICENCKSCMIASHVSKEPAGRLVLEALGLEPMVMADMCLGEGTGALTVIPMIRMAAAVYNKMGVFGEVAIEQYEDYES